MEMEKTHYSKLESVEYKFESLYLEVDCLVIRAVSGFKVESIQ
jgi:hypothetical protein